MNYKISCVNFGTTIPFHMQVFTVQMTSNIASELNCVKLSFHLKVSQTCYALQLMFLFSVPSLFSFFIDKVHFLKQTLNEINGTVLHK